MPFKASLVFCVLLLSIHKSESFPVSVDIGTFTIDDYVSNGGGAVNLTGTNSAAIVVVTDTGSGVHQDLAVNQK